MRLKRNEYGWKLIQLTEVLGHDENYLSDVENSRKPPPKYNTMLRLARLLRISAEDVLITSAYTERLRHQLGLIGKDDKRKNRRVNVTLSKVGPADGEDFSEA